MGACVKWMWLNMGSSYGGAGCGLRGVSILNTKAFSLVVSLIVAFGAGLAWGQSGVGWLVFAALPPVVWMLSSSRWSGAFFILVYHLVASRGLPGGATVFFSEASPVWWGWVLWVGVAVCSALPWCVFWRADAGRRALWLPVVFIVLVLPPFGLISWNSPLLAAGVLFPGLGFVGLLGLLGAWMAVGMRSGVLGMCVVVLCGWALLTAQSGVSPAGWVGVDTHYGRLAGGSGEDGVTTVGRLRDVRRIGAALPRGAIAVLPETVLGSLDAVILGEVDVISVPLARRGAGMLIGAELPVDVDGRVGAESYVNAVVGMGTLQGVVVKQRVPVPIGMWRPWSDSGAIADVWGAGVVNILGDRAAILICYEQLIVWPVLVSGFSSPSVLVGVANGWWSRDTSIPAIQSQSLASWGRLFGVPVVSAVNI